MNEQLIRAEVDLSAIAHNVRELRRITNPRAELLVAVKANGYGHGALEVAATALENGASALGVARISEGIALRQKGITAPILIFSPTRALHADRLVAENLTPSVSSVESAAALSEAASAAPGPLAIHIKVDTGMGRLGVLSDGLRADRTQKAIDDIKAIAAMPNLKPEGLFTHFATSDHQDKAFANEQFKRFQDLAAQVKTAGIGIAKFHAANSGAIIDMPDTHLDMVRAGICVYGLAPSSEVNLSRIDLKPAMQLKTRIVHLKTVPAGTPVSYGCTYRTPKATRIATLAAGYGDGLSRHLSNKGYVLAGGCRVPIVGRVCMDLSMVDVGAVPRVRIGDEVVIFGRQAGATVGADEIAEAAGTINYEVVTALTGRVPRIYIDPDQSGRRDSSAAGQ